MTKMEEEAWALFKKDNPKWTEHYPQWENVSNNERYKYILMAKNAGIANRVMGNNEGSVEDTLKQRGSVYGSYEDVCALRAKILSLLNYHKINVTKEPMSPIQEVAFGDLVLKLVRGAGAPNYKDSFHDLGGYAKLMEDMIDETNS